MEAERQICKMLGRIQEREMMRVQAGKVRIKILKIWCDSCWGQDW